MRISATLTNVSLLADSSAPKARWTRRERKESTSASCFADFILADQGGGGEFLDPSGTSAIGPSGWHHRWYHTSMEKTTLYLPEDLKSAVKRAAAERGVSEAEVIRESIRVSVGGVRPRARGALYSSGQPIARDAEEMLAGFGER